MHDDIGTQVARLQRLPATDDKVLSVYLNTRWSDEHQRDRTRVFLTRELHRAREAGEAAPEDLEWIEQQGRLLVDQVRFPDAHGVALFACQARGLREMIPVRVPFAERFVVDTRLDLRGLVEVFHEHAAAIVVFVDSESARLILLHPSGTDPEVRLEHDVPRHHRRGGWAQLSQSAYARHIEVHRDRHFEAVAEAVTRAVDTQGIRRIILAGLEDRVTAFRQHLPERVRWLVAGHIHATRWEPASAIVRRAAERLDLREQSDVVVEVDDVLTEAAKGGRAIAGSSTLEAARLGAIHRLYILSTFRRHGRACAQCDALLEEGLSCRFCGGATHEVELGAALVDRVVKTGGRVETIHQHEGLAAMGGIAARLRYPL